MSLHQMAMVATSWFVDFRTPESNLKRRSSEMMTMAKAIQIARACVQTSPSDRYSPVQHEKDLMKDKDRNEGSRYEYGQWNRT